MVASCLLQMYCNGDQPFLLSTSLSLTDGFSLCIVLPAWIWTSSKLFINEGEHVPQTEMQ